MNTITVKQALNLMNSGLFFGLHGYVKADGSTRKFNARQGVKKHSAGGKWSGNAQKNILLAEPVNPKTAKMASDNGQKVNPYRTLKIDSLIGCTLKAQGQEYTIIA